MARVPAMEFGLLGPVVVHSCGRQVPVRRGNQRALLAALLLEANRPVTTDKLTEVLWGPAPPPSALVTIRNYVKRLRQALGGDDRARIRAEPRGYLMRVGADELDVARLKMLLMSARSAARSAAWDKSAARARAALALWRGQPLADVESDMLALQYVPSLAELRLQALETRIDAQLHLGGHAEVVAELQQMAAAHPLREQAHALLMLALYRCGRAGEALATYQRARSFLREELGIEPHAGLQHLHQQILSADPALAAPLPGGPVPTAAAASAPLPPVAATAGPARRADMATEVSSMADRPVGATSRVNPVVPEPMVLAARQASAIDGRAAAVPRQLPGTAPHFTGRAAELAALTRVLDQASAYAPGTAVVSAIGGTAGVGKTALAVYWAHQVASRFPGGQLYVNLRGYGPSGTPISPGKAIRGFLDALGVPASRVPRDLGARAGLYRSLLSGRQMLIVLDNARDERQVRPLLPAGPGCMALVTSRRQLVGLAADGARLLSIDVFSQAEAREMFTARLGTGGAVADPGTVTEITELCDRLPLALAVAAARTTTSPGLALPALAAELRNAATRLDVLDTGDPAASVRGVFSWSTERLSAAAARMFHLIGLHPGPDISAPAAAILADVPPHEARQALSELTRAHLLTEQPSDTYMLHDLLRAYATE